MKTRVLAILILLSLGISGFYLKDEAARWLSDVLSAGKVDPVPLLKLKKRNYQVTVSVSGELTGLHIMPVLAPRVKAESLKIAWRVEEGQIVAAGEPVVRFDPTDALLSLEQSQNKFASFDHRIDKAQLEAQSQQQLLEMDLRAAGLQLDYAKSQIRQDEEIFSRWKIQESIVSAALARYRTDTLRRKEELQQSLSQADLRILEVEQKAAQSQIDLAQGTLSALEAKSPMGGAVLYLPFNYHLFRVQNEVWPGQPLMEIASLNQFQGRMHVVERDIAGVEENKKVRVRLEAFPAKTFEGRIEQVDRVANQIHREDPRKYFGCRISLDVPLEIMERLKPGMKFTGEIERAMRKDVFVLPKSAVMSQDDEFLVFVKRGSEYSEQKVKILDSDHGFYTIEGPAEDDEVCLRHPYETEQLHLPDFNAPAAPTQGRRFMIFF